MNIETLYTIVDEFLKIIGNKSSNNSKLINSEIITIYIKSFESYGGNYSKTIDNMYQGGNISYKISRSRFSRRINLVVGKLIKVGMEVSRQDSVRITSLPSFSAR